MVERIKSPFSTEDQRSQDDLVLESKEVRDKEDQLFQEIIDKINSWHNTQMVEVFALEKLKGLKSEIGKLRTVKRSLSFGRGNPENYWDFFEMFDFICFLRVRHNDFLKTILTNYKGGRFAR